jgi:hypothetical protein
VRISRAGKIRAMIKLSEIGRLNVYLNETPKSKGLNSLAVPASMNGTESKKSRKAFLVE